MTDRPTDTEQCPPWCARRHDDVDHPEDRLHRDAGRVIAVITASGSIGSDLTAAATHLTIQRVRAFGAERTWVRIQEAEGTAHHLTIDDAGASLLSAVLDRIATSDRT